MKENIEMNKKTGQEKNIIIKMVQYYLKANINMEKNGMEKGKYLIIKKN